MNDMIKLPEMTVLRLEAAREYAEEGHAGQTYGAHDFTYHLDRVTETLIRFGFQEPIDLPVLVASQLHDIVEDTETTLDEVEEVFGSTVRHLVDAVTDVPEGKNRRVRQTATYAKLRRIAHEVFPGRPWPLALKLADRIANFEASGAGINSKHFRMYQHEHPWFCRNMGMLYADDPRIQRMWDYLDKLATTDPRRGAVREVCNLIREPGPHPEFHAVALNNLRREWPSMFKALDRLLAVDPL